jgi:ankyrin repeat protein
MREFQLKKRLTPDLNAKDKSGRTALMRAAVMGHEGVVQQLIKAGVDVNGRDIFGNTALSMLQPTEDFPAKGRISKMLKDAGAK